MPRYAKQVLARFKHEKPGKPQHSPYQPPPRKDGTESQETLPEDNAIKVNTEQVKIIQQVVGGVLYYAQVVDCTVLASLHSIDSKQAQASEGTEKRMQQLLDYLRTQPDATVQ